MKVNKKYHRRSSGVGKGRLRRNPKKNYGANWYWVRVEDGVPQKVDYDGLQKIKNSMRKHEVYQIGEPGKENQTRLKHFSALPKTLFHGTSEESLAKMPITGGLSTRQGVIYLTDAPNYARFKARQATTGTRFKPVSIEVKTPEDVERVGRHFITRKPISSREFIKVKTH